MQIILRSLCVIRVCMYWKGVCFDALFLTHWNLANSKYQSRHGEADGHGVCAEGHSYIAFVSWLYPGQGQ